MIEIEKAELLCKLCYAKGFATAVFVAALAAAIYYAAYLRAMCCDIQEKMEEMARRMAEHEEKMRKAEEDENEH